MTLLQAAVTTATDASLSSALTGVMIAALGALAAAIVTVGTYGALYLRTLIETRTEDLRLARTTRLTVAGDTAVAATEEHARATGIKGEAKAQDAKERVLAMLPEQKPTPEQLTTVVRAGVTRMRASLPWPSQYAIHASRLGSLSPSPLSSLPPPSRVPIEALPPPPQRKSEP